MNDVEPSLVDKVIILDDTLSANGITHAFGGALALAYYTFDPRATADIDVNISVDAADAEAVFSVLPSGIERDAGDLERVRSDDQVRLWWGRNPVDLFFRASEFHDGVAARVERHQFASTQLPFIAASDLAVFKTLFNRPKDWVDIDSMRQARSIDVAAVAEVVRSLVGDDDRVSRLLALADAP